MRLTRRCLVTGSKVALGFVSCSRHSLNHALPSGKDRSIEGPIHLYPRHHLAYRYRGLHMQSRTASTQVEVSLLLMSSRFRRQKPGLLGNTEYILIPIRDFPLDRALGVLDTPPGSYCGGALLSESMSPLRWSELRGSNSSPSV